MKIDINTARTVLFEEAARASAEPPHSAWAAKFEKLDQLCRNIAQTHIAALGTALLAKAVNLDVDVYALKRTRGGPRAYVARQLAKEVLAAHAPELEIDIGVYGREPLNNQPYFRESRISREMPVKANARPALFHLVDILDALDRVESSARAREALRTYIYVRRQHFRRPGEVSDADELSVSAMLERIDAFTRRGSEGGKRAQAVAAGILDAALGRERVRTNRINDPDRNLPGDVGVLALEAPDQFERVLEVRDKVVSGTDLHHLLTKALAGGVSRVCMLTVAARQRPISAQAVKEVAETRGVHLTLCEGWHAFVDEALFWSSCNVRTFPAKVLSHVDRRLIWLDVKPETLSEWRELNSLVSRG